MMKRRKSTKALRKTLSELAKARWKKIPANRRREHGRMMGKAGWPTDPVALQKRADDLREARRLARERKQSSQDKE